MKQHPLVREPDVPHRPRNPACARNLVLDDAVEATEETRHRREVRGLEDLHVIEELGHVAAEEALLATKVKAGVHVHFLDCERTNQ